MLAELHIENFVIIDRLSLKFDSGLCVITGETGAGKSLIVGALQLVLGERGGADKIKSGKDFLKITARFHPSQLARKIIEQAGFDADELIISRRITSNGRSSFWINETPVSAETVRKIGNFLVDLHGQHSHQLLLDKSTHLSLLDDFGELHDISRQVSELFHQYRDTASKLEKLRSQREEIKRKQRLVEFELNELTDAEITSPDEEEILEHELEVVEAAEKMINFGSKLSHIAVEQEGSIVEIVGNLQNEISEFPHTKEISQISQLLETISAAAEEISLLAGKLSAIEYDTEHADKIRERLKLLGDLQRKYGMNLKELIEYREKLKKEHIELGDIDEMEKSTEQQLLKIEKKLQRTAKDLSNRRHRYAKKLSDAVEKELAPLAMKEAKFSVNLELIEDKNSPFELNGKKIKLFEHGFERCEFLLSANPGTAPKELRKIASGGELSRVALALKIALPASNRVGCSFFDEIDAGIGGMTAIKIAECLKKLSKNRQIIVITHLHPIARRANLHIYIEKKIKNDTTSISAKILSEKERKTELKRMMSIELPKPSA